MTFSGTSIVIFRVVFKVWVMYQLFFVFVGDPQDLTDPFKTLTVFKRP